MAVFVCSTSLHMYGNRSWFKEATFQVKYGHMKILVWSSKFGLKRQRFWSRTNWKRVQTSWRRILGQKKLRRYCKLFWRRSRNSRWVSLCSSLIQLWLNKLPITSFIFGISFIWIAHWYWVSVVHVKEGWLCRKPNANGNVFQHFC